MIDDRGVERPDEAAVEAALMNDALQVVRDLPRYTTPYDFPIALHENYDSLLSRGAGTLTSVAELLGIVMSRGQAMVHGGGGTGKTSVIRQIAHLASEAGILPLIITLSAWPSSLDEEWQLLADSELGRIDLLLTRLGRPACSFETLSVVSDRRPVLLLVDGLNESARNVGNDILITLSWFATHVSRAAVIVTDRLSRRPVSERWILTAIGHLYGDRGLGGIAFFRDRLGEAASEAISMSTAQNQFLRDHADLDDEQIERVAAASFDAYVQQHARTFSLNRFESLAGNDAVKRLRRSGVLAVEDGQGRFEHHLYHDFLAAVELASRGPADWKWGTFDSISFKGSSFDALAMTLEQLPDENSTDELLRRIYDWNFYGAAYALSNAESASVRPDTEAVITLALGERQWDPMLATVTQVTDALRLFSSPLSRQLLELRSGSTEAVRQIAPDYVARDGPLGLWLEVFTVPNGAQLPDHVVHLLDEKDSFVGWTLANTLKRVTLSPGQAEWLRERLINGTEAVRWRAAHALGGHRDPAHVDALLVALNDDHHWVQYGALRSLIETASIDEALARLIVARLVEELNLLNRAPHLRAALERFVLLRNPPTDWAARVRPLIDALWLQASTQAELDRWKTLAARVAATTGGASVA